MHKNVVYVFMMFSFATLVYGDSKTIFVPRSITNNSVFELAMTNYSFQTDKIGLDNVIALKSFYQNTNAGCSLRNFFLKDNKDFIILREDGQGDVNPLWTSGISQLNTSYQSGLTMAPVRTTIGAIVTAYFDLHRYLKHAWLSVNTAFVHARHHLHLAEVDLIHKGVLRTYHNFCHMFDHPTFSIGRLTCRELTNTRLDDIQLKLGYDFSDNERRNISPYITMMIPTGKIPENCRIFSPLVGSKNIGLGAGFNTNFELGRHVHWMVDAKYDYFFGGKQRRVFDLKNNGDWSRYLSVVTESEPYNSAPGVNSLSQEVKVTPGNIGQCWTALHWNRNDWHIEGGYNFWIRSKEKVCLLSDRVVMPNTDDPVGITDLIAFVPPLPPATTASTAQIQQSVIGKNPVVSDTVFTPVTVDDFNIDSARNVRGFSHTLYLAIRYQAHEITDLYIDFAGSYEFGRTFGVANQYALWGSMTFEF